MVTVTVMVTATVTVTAAGADGAGSGEQVRPDGAAPATVLAARWRAPLWPAARRAPPPGARYRAEMQISSPRAPRRARFRSSRVHGVCEV